MNRLINISKQEEIFKEYQNTPISELLQYHNMGKPLKKYPNAQLLIGMCMDNRKYLTLPYNFAFIIRTGGANLRYSEFKVSYAISVGGVKYIALIGHENCGMVNLISKKKQFIDGLVDNAGWEIKEATEHFNHFSPMFEIGNEIDFVLSESKRLRIKYPKICIVPLFYKMGDNKLYLIEENDE